MAGKSEEGTDHTPDLLIFIVNHENSWTDERFSGPGPGE